MDAHRAIFDMSNYQNMFDEEKEDGEEDINVAGGKFPIPPDS